MTTATAATITIIPTTDTLTPMATAQAEKRNGNDLHLINRRHAGSVTMEDTQYAICTVRINICGGYV